MNSTMERLARVLAGHAYDQSHQVLDENERDAWVDARWRHSISAAVTVVRAINQVDSNALHAAFVAMNNTPSGTWKRLKAAGGTPETLFKAKMIPRLHAYFNHILSQTPNHGSER